MAGKHPGFKAVQKKIEGEGYSKEAAGAILAKKTREASASAKKANPRLKRVRAAKPKGKKKDDYARKPTKYDHDKVVSRPDYE